MLKDYSRPYDGLDKDGRKEETKRLQKLLNAQQPLLSGAKIPVVVLVEARNQSMVVKKIRNSSATQATVVLPKRPPVSRRNTQRKKAKPRTLQRIRIR